MKQSDHFRENAENCAQLAERATDDATHKRYGRMEAAWLALVKSKTGWMLKYPRGECRPNSQPWSTAILAYIFTGAIFAAKPFGVMRYAASLPSPLRSIQPFPSSFDINFGLSGKLVCAAMRRHANTVETAVHDA